MVILELNEAPMFTFPMDGLIFCSSLYSSPPPRVGDFRWRVRGKWRHHSFCEIFKKYQPMRGMLFLIGRYEKKLQKSQKVHSLLLPLTLHLKFPTPLTFFGMGSSDCHACQLGKEDFWAKLSAPIIPGQKGRPLG